MLRETHEIFALNGNTPAMLKLAAVGFARFFKAIPFVSAVGIFEEFNHHTVAKCVDAKCAEEHCDNCINLAVFLHNPPVLQRKPGAYWDPCGIGEWMIHSDYDIYETFGNDFIEKLGEYSRELPIMYCPNLTIIIFDELVVSDPTYRACEWKNWKSRKFIKHVFKSLKFWNEAKQDFLPDKRWENAAFDSKPYHWVWRNGSLVPIRKQPKFIGKSDGFFDKIYHATSYCAKAKPWEEAGIVNEAAAKRDGFERCKNCLPKIDA